MDDKCPYLDQDDCGYPNKDPLKYCKHYWLCVSYKFLEESKVLFEEEKKDD